MAFHPIIIAQGVFNRADDRQVALLIEDDEITREDAEAAAAKGELVPFVTVLGSVDFSETARALCERLGVQPDDAHRRIAETEAVIDAAHDPAMQEAMARCGAEDLLRVMASYAKAGAAIMVVE